MDTIKAATSAVKEAVGNAQRDGGSNEVLTAFLHVSKPSAQHQSEPGLDAKMDPVAEFTRQEAWKDGKPYLREYVGSGKLLGKSALITGGDSGIGRSVAQMFAREGADVSIVYLPQEQQDADAVKAAIEKDGRRCLQIPVDITDETNCKLAVDKHVNAYGRIDILVSNAARQTMETDAAELDLESVELTYRTNVLSAYAFVKYSVPHMQAGSNIIFSTSVGAYDGKCMSAKLSYSGTKGALATLTRSLAMQLAPKYIRVNAVAPGPIWTPINVNPPGQPAEATQDMMYKSDMIALQRIGQPSELGPAYVFLASPDASYVTGAVIQVNGGGWTGS